MFFPDRSSAYREAKRVLKPGGRFLFNVWDRIEENVFADDVTNALARIFPNDPPRFLARTPHGYHDTALIRSELEDAGFSGVAIETKAEQSRASPPRLPAVAYCQGTLLRNEIEARDAGNWKLQPTTPHPRLQTDMAAARLLPKFKHTRSWPRSKWWNPIPADCFRREADMELIYEYAPEAANIQTKHLPNIQRLQSRIIPSATHNNPTHTNVCVRVQIRRLRRHEWTLTLL
jgi:SAM-dependent methyltransferase